MRRRRRKGGEGTGPGSGDGPPTDPTELLLVTAEEADREIVDRALPHTMTGPARLLALIDAVRHLHRRGIGGDFAECGVWRGGSVLAMLLAMLDEGDERDVWLYDTFSGMTEPTERDTSPVDRPAVEHWEETKGKPWPVLFDSEGSSLDAVRELLAGSGYPRERLHFIEGPVEETIPSELPGPLALLRLDTDWYESTRHELEHLYPLLSSGGVLIVDDYGHWEGARAAVDEYFGGLADPPLLHRVDYTCRIAVKP